MNFLRSSGRSSFTLGKLRRSCSWPSMNKISGLCCFAGLWVSPLFAYAMLRMARHSWGLHIWLHANVVYMYDTVLRQCACKCRWRATDRGTAPNSRKHQTLSMKYRTAGKLGAPTTRIRRRCCISQQHAHMLALYELSTHGSQTRNCSPIRTGASSPESCLLYTSDAADE